MKLGINRLEQQGFGAIMAIIVLVILGALAAAMTRFSSIQQTTSAQDVLAVRALAAARAGTEWGLYRIMKGAPGWCDTSGATENLDLTADTGFHVTTVCELPKTYTEGQELDGGVLQDVQMRIYKLTATACNMPAGTGNKCPNADAVAMPGYVERQRQTVVACQWGPTPAPGACKP